MDLGLYPSVCIADEVGLGYLFLFGAIYIAHYGSCLASEQVRNGLASVLMIGNC
jgi:hypothetical protein